jgi:hypothetical protein
MENCSEPSGAKQASLSGYRIQPQAGEWHRVEGVRANPLIDLDQLAAILFI